MKNLSGFFYVIVSLLFCFSGNIFAQKSVECWERFELSFKHADNPFLVKLSATFVCKGEKKRLMVFMMATIAGCQNNYEF